jgi:hypothetical protein
VPLVVLTACEYVVVYCCTPCDGFRLILVGTLPLEQLVMVSMQPSVLKAAVLSYDELFAGQVLPGTVSKVVVVPVGDPSPGRNLCGCAFQVSTVAEYGVLVSLGQGIRGIVSPHHITDATGGISKVSCVTVLCQHRSCLDEFVQPRPKSRLAQLSRSACWK